MRQFFTVRFWMAVGAVVGLFALLWVLLPRDDDPVLGGGEPEAPLERDIDLIEPLFAVTGSDDFAMVDGVADGELVLIIDGQRTLTVVPGTPGEITCTELLELGQCAVAVDLLGDAVLWFSLFSAELDNSIELPAIRELRDQNEVLLVNDWLVRRADVVTRTCDEDTTSLGDFVRTFGDEATSFWSVTEQRIVRVAC